jgi:hypothetical protein
MATQGDKLSPLFKSLQPNKSQFEASNIAVVQEAEQRWPLFKAVAPVKPEVPPALNEEDRQHWRNKGGAEKSITKPALSVPGLSDKLAQSLSKMGGEKSSTRRTAKAPKIDKEVKPMDPVYKAPTTQPLPVSVQPINKAPVTKASTVSESTHSEPAVVSPIPVVKSEAPLILQNTVVQHDSIVIKDQARAMDSRKVATSTNEIVSKPFEFQAAVLTGDTPVRANESLKSLFSRLEKPEPPKVQISIKTKTSFLGRLGKR